MLLIILYIWFCGNLYIREWIYILYAANNSPHVSTDTKENIRGIGLERECKFFERFIILTQMKFEIMYACDWEKVLKRRE